MAERQTSWALLLAAGSGRRAGGPRPKQYRPIGGRTLLRHALDHLDHPAIDAIQVVIGAGQRPLYDEAVQGFARPLAEPVTGGATRQESVRRGLEALSRRGRIDRVFIHDAARPLLPPTVIERQCAALDQHDGAVPVLPVVDTLVRAGDALGETIPRETLLRVQTPQAFRFAAILAAHRTWTGGEASDDGQVARAAGLSVVTVAGDERLAKMTFEEDLARADDRLNRLETRTGLGFDVHAFMPGDHVMLGGLRIPHDRGLAGHSDADVLLHAITDALLGAAGQGDIGLHFPPSDPKWKGAASSLFLDHARELVEAAGGTIVHIDATLIGEAPRLAPHREAMRERLAVLLRLPVGRISLKGTTTEGLGFAGRREGLAAQAIATISFPES